MSLLNQVLQDLEKRNADTENASDQLPMANIKAVPTVNNKPSLFSWLLPITAIALALLAYRHYQPQDSLIDTNVKEKAVSKPLRQTIALNPADKIPLKRPVKATTVSKLDIQEKAVPAPITVIENKPKTQKQTILPKTSRKKKALSAKRKLIKKRLALNNVQKAEKLFSRIKKQSPSVKKADMLKLAIKLNPQHINARLLLSTTLLQLGLSSEAEMMLDQNLLLFPQNLQFTNLRSQLFLQNKQVKPALLTLQKINARYIQDETYLALLAAAFQQNSRHAESLETYQRLLKINSEKAEYWLGSAISQEKLGYRQQALQAYQQALNKNTLKTVIVDYIYQRISILK